MDGGSYNVSLIRKHLLATDLLLVTKVFLACILSRSSGKCNPVVDWDY
jgi:hypothetical protein